MGVQLELFSYSWFKQRRETFAWLLVTLQFCLLITNTFRDAAGSTDGRATPATTSHLKSESPHTGTLASSPSSSASSAPPPEDTEIRRTLVDEDTGERFLKVFHTGRTHHFDPLRGGSCWCTPGSDDFCVCTPSLAIDVVLASGNDHVWLVRRKDTGQYAAMGGFVEVGETAEEAVARELSEETGLELEGPLVLLGMYSDPRRDWNRHRHSVSAVYVVQIPPGSTPVAGDDVKRVERVALDDVDKLDFFIDHGTILLDYKRALMSGSSFTKNWTGDAIDFASPFRRTVCGGLQGNVQS